MEEYMKNEFKASLATGRRTEEESTKFLKKLNLSKKGYIALIFGLLMIALTLFSGIMPANQCEFELSEDEAKDGYNYYLPRFTLPKGEYSFELSGSGGLGKIIIESGDGEVVFDGQISDLKANEVSLSKDYTELVIKQQDGAELKRLIVKGHGAIFNDRYFLALVLLFALLWLLYVKYGKHKDNIDAYMPVFLVCVALTSSYMFFTHYLSFGHDTLFHLERIEGIKEGLQAGQFPVRIQPRQINGYGYSVSLYYPDLFLYFPAILRLCGVSLVMAYQSLWVAASIATALITYYSVKGITKSRYSASAAAIIYTTCTWRIFNICIRGAMGEGLAMVFFPLFIYGVYEIIWGDKKWWILALSATFILQSHIISTVVCAIFGIIIFAVFARRLTKDRRWEALLKAFGIILLLNAWFLLAFVTTYCGFDINSTFDLSKETEFPDQSVLPAQLFNMLNTSTAMGKPFLAGVSGSLSLSPGIGVCICLAISAAYFSFPAEKRRTKTNGFMPALFVIGIMFLVMSTSLFPWRWLANNIGALNALGNIIQFPWRFLAIASAIICVVGAWVIGMHRNGKAMVFLVIVSMFCALSVVITGSAALSKGMDLKKGTYPLKEDNVFVSYDYIPAALDTNASFDCNEYKTSSGSFGVKEYKKSGTNISVELSKAPGSNDAWIEVPLIYYWGYKATDGAGQKLNVVQGDNGLVKIMLKPDSGSVRLKYSGTWFYRLGDIITLMTLLGLLAVIIIKHSEGKDRTFAENAKRKDEA